MATTESFNIKSVHDLFSSSLLENEDVDMESYLLAYKELYKFFELMGSIFSFVASDLKDKIGILEELQKADSTGNFSTFKKMVNYERDNGLLNKQGYVSGSRTLLRLHRGLDFIRLFLKQIEELKAEEKTVKACQDAYNCTLAKYHGWLIRKSAVLAMHALPTREALLIKVCGSREEIERGVQVLPKMLEVTAEAYKRTDDLYTACDLHGLP